MSGQLDRYMKGDISKMAQEMKKMINNKDMSDIKFLVGPNRKAIYAHRNILSARCAVFRAMFNDQAKSGSKEEIPFVLTEIQPEIFLALLEYIYTNCVTLSSKSGIEVLCLSMEYGLEELQRLCVKYLVATLNTGNVCESMQAAVSYGLDDLKSESLAFIELNAQDIFNTKGFHEMSDDTLCAVLESDLLEIDEKDIYESVKEWANVHSVTEKQPVGKVARSVVDHVRLPVFTPDELTGIEAENENSGLFPVDNISFAWKIHALKKVDSSNPLTRLRKGTNARDSHKVLGL